MKQYSIIISLCLFIFSCKGQQKDSGLRYEPDWHPSEWEYTELKGNVKRVITKYQDVTDSYYNEYTKKVVTLESHTYYDTTEYNSFSKPVKSADGSTYSYNSQNLLVKRVVPSISQEYDANTNDFIYKPVPRIYTYAYNEAGLVTREENFFGDKKEIAIAWEYDDKNRLLTRTDQSDSYTIKESYSYGSNTIQLTIHRSGYSDAGTKFSGSETYTWIYDERGKKVKKEMTTSLSSDKLISHYRYNDKNQLVKIESGYSSTQYKYDKQGNIAEYTYLDPGTGEIIGQWSFAYDKQGNCIYCHEISKIADTEKITERKIEYR